MLKIRGLAEDSEKVSCKYELQVDVAGCGCSTVEISEEEKGFMKREG